MILIYITQRLKAFWRLVQQAGFKTNKQVAGNSSLLRVNKIMCFALMNGMAFSGFSLSPSQSCSPLLWPANSPVIDTSLSTPYGLMKELQKWSEKCLSDVPHPMATLSSAGRTNLQDPILQQSRNALKDADRAAILALTYRLTNNPNYLNATINILIAWAMINHPTGNPIDETRLEGMLWAYDLISCDISAEKKKIILGWLNRMKNMKDAWKFGHITESNNHRIHQLKMMLLLDKLLQKDHAWETDLATAQKYSLINLDSQSGQSLDYIQRNALYYQNYVMQPWLEIGLISGCCTESIKKGFLFLSHNILSHNIKGEFLNSMAPIDKSRAQGGFLYAKAGGQFDITKAAPTIISYYTLVKDAPDPALWYRSQHSKTTPRLVFLNARRQLWGN